MAQQSGDSREAARETSTITIVSIAVLASLTLLLDETLRYQFYIILPGIFLAIAGLLYREFTIHQYLEDEKKKVVSEERRTRFMAKNTESQSRSYRAVFSSYPNVPLVSNYSRSLLVTL